jgi:hypothetical protein
MAICWARCIGACGGGWSKEPLPSLGFFGEGPITIAGWGEPARKIPANRAGSKILCKSHNERQPADNEGKRFPARGIACVLFS